MSYSHPNDSLSIQTFYILLAFARGEMHAYAIKAAVRDCSTGGVSLPNSQLYALITRLHDEGLIEMTGTKLVRDKPRIQYGLSRLGTIRLQEELQRFEHAIAIGRAVGLMDNLTPTDIQRLQLAVADSSKTSNT